MVLSNTTCSYQSKKSTTLAFWSTTTGADISFEMNMAYSVFQFQVSFWEAPWSCLVCYVQSVITTTRGHLSWSFLSSKQCTAYCFVFPFSIQYHYSGLTIFYFYIIVRYTCIGTFAYIFHWRTTILLNSSYFILNCHKTLFYHKYWTCSFVVFSNTIVFYSSERNPQLRFLIKKQVQKPNSCDPNQYTTERRSTTRGQLIMVR